MTGPGLRRNVLPLSGVIGLDAFEQLLAFIDGFQSPLGMEALASVDWLIAREGCEAKRVAIGILLAKSWS
jgi:hypothetical protein